MLVAPDRYITGNGAVYISGETKDDTIAFLIPVNKSLPVEVSVFDIGMITEIRNTSGTHNS